MDDGRTHGRASDSWAGGWSTSEKDAFPSLNAKGIVFFFFFLSDVLFGHNFMQKNCKKCTKHSHILSPRYPET